MITNEVYMEIEILRKHGFSLRRIAAAVGCAVNTVRGHLSAGVKPKYERQKRRLAKLSPYEAYLRAGKRAAAIMSLIQSAKLNGHDPFLYLKDILSRLPTQPNTRINELLPHHWQPEIST